MAHPHLQEAIQAIKRGDKDQARRLLKHVVREEPKNEQAWLWLSAVLTSPQQQRDCLQRVLQINPANQQAVRGLELLEAAAAPTPAPAPPEPARAVPAFPASATTPDPEPQSTVAPQQHSDDAFALPASATSDPEPQSRIAPQQHSDDDFVWESRKPAPRQGCIPLQRFGTVMIIIGIGSFILPMFGFQFVLISAFGPGMQLAAGVGLTLLGIVVVGGNMLASRLSGKTLLLASGSILGVLMLCMVGFVITGFINMQADVGELTTYTHETGLFSIQVPTSWEQKDHSNGSTVRIDWHDFRSNGSINAGLTVEVFRTDDAATSANLTSRLQSHLTERHSIAYGFALGDPAVHTDGRVEIPFEYGRLQARSMIEQRGDTLSILTISIRPRYYDQLAETCDTMLESYALDLSVPLN
jgi:hypothetical protein